MALSGTFSATGQSSEFVSKVGRNTMTLGLTASSWGSVNLEIKLGADWYILETFTASGAKLVDTDGRTNTYRLNCTARTADITYFLE